jgi:NAD(P)-dependent dehydrogenase (short-subunit alcohol dehydrogenase family)
MSERYLRGKHVIVTGAGRGIGAAIAQELAARGARLSLLGRNLARLTAQARSIKSKHKVRVQSVQCDISDPTAITRAFQIAADRLGVPYALVNNAGEVTPAPFAKMTREQWDSTIATNLTGSVLCMQQVLPGMIEIGRGRIINIASTAGLKGYSRLAAYCASKHGLMGVTRAVALETARSGVTVNAVCPGYTDTEMTRSGIQAVRSRLSVSEGEAEQMLLRSIPRGSFITPAEVANAVAWLCSPGASAVTGQAIVVAGGEFV